MKKTIRTLMLIFVLAITACLFTGITVYAEEVPNEGENAPVSAGEVIDKMTENSPITDEDIQLIKDLVAKVESYTAESDSYFMKFILPVLVGAGLVLLFGIVLLLPFMRTKGEVKTVKSMLDNAKKIIKEKTDELEKLRADTDMEAVKKDIHDFVSAAMENFSLLLKDNLSALSSAEVQNDAKLTALIAAAQNVWRGSPEAVDKLSEVTSKSEVAELREKNNKMEAFIYGKYGEEASELINSL